jgi:hypothetical protein
LLSADNNAPNPAPTARPEVPGQQRKGKQGRPTIVLGDPQQIAAELMEHLTLEQLTEVTELLLKQVTADANS